MIRIERINASLKFDLRLMHRGGEGDRRGGICAGDSTFRS